MMVAYQAIFIVNTLLMLQYYIVGSTRTAAIQHSLAVSDARVRILLALVTAVCLLPQNGVIFAMSKNVSNPQQLGAPFHRFQARSSEGSLAAHEETQCGEQQW